MGISKRGDKNLRRLLVQWQERICDDWTDAAGQWRIGCGACSHDDTRTSWPVRLRTSWRVLHGRSQRITMFNVHGVIVFP